MRRNVAWPGVAVKTAKGRRYHYWTQSDPWVRLPDPATNPDGFMRKLADLQRLTLKLEDGGRAGTLADAIRLYRKHPDFTDREPATRKLYDTYMERLKEIWPEAALNEITPQLVQQFVMDEHADTRGAANVMLKVLHILYKWAGKRRAGLVDPTLGIDPYEVGEHAPWPDHILEAAMASEDWRFRLAVKLHLYTGQRTGDACRMTWNIITADGHIPVKQQKTKTPLLIPLHPDLAGEIASVPRPALTILANRMNAPLKSQAFRAWADKFAEPFKVELVPHGLRKNAVNGLLEAGCSTAEVSSITGQSLAMVEHYGKLRDQPKLASVAMIKWGAGHSANGKTFAHIENRAGKGL